MVDVWCSWLMSVALVFLAWLPLSVVLVLIGWVLPAFWVLMLSGWLLLAPWSLAPLPPCFLASCVPCLLAY